MKKNLFLLSVFLGLLIFPGVLFPEEEVLTWIDCVREAAKNHPDLIVAIETVEQNKSQEDITKSALYPQVTASLNAGTAKSGKTTTDTYSYGASGSQLVFDGFKTSADLKGAREDTQASREDYKFVSSTVRQRLRSAFVSVMRAQALIRVTEDIIRIRRNNLVLISLRYETGLEHKGAFLTAEANMEQAKYELEEARRTLIVAQRQLTKEMGRSEFIPMVVRENFDIKDIETEKPDFKGILLKNPQLLEEAALTRAARYGVASARANFFPVVTGTTGVGKTGGHWPSQTGTWNLGMGLSMPLFEGGLKTAQLHQAKSSLLGQEASERSTRDTVIVNLEETWAALRDSVENVSVREKFLVATQVRSKIAQAQYSVGLMTYDNWTIIEDDLVSAKKDLLNSQADALFAEANWIEAKGETLEQEK